MVEGAFVDVDLQSRGLPKETQNVKDGELPLLQDLEIELHHPRKTCLQSTCKLGDRETRITSSSKNPQA
jgi:hypothetical protein